MSTKFNNFFALALSWIDKITVVFAKASLVCGLLLTLLVVIGTIARYVFNYPLGWRDELTAYIFLFHCFLALAYATYREAHIAAEMLYVHFPPKLQFIISFLGYVLAMICTVLICYYGFKTTYQYFVRGWASDTPYATPLWPIVLIVPLGFLMFGLQCVSRLNTIIERMRATGSVLPEQGMDSFGLNKAKDDK
ncbi:MAG: TRAP transporter small permease [Candidatus Helarchaeota archaeon]|jgi:TRAP-type mannitol/chloroaromatic compound transport system permease small subunit|nr:TRAP transporter small permease [Candidatus Helarchaeota archaeon]